jgi:hypothetical protein
MENKENNFDTISSENYKHQLDIWFKTHNVNREKTELFSDYIISFSELLENTFMGCELYENDLDKKNHFTWCWDKIIDNFSKEKIIFKNRGNCYEYFWNFFLEAFYFAEIEKKQHNIKNYFQKLFDFEYRKTRSELDVLTEIYKLFDQNLKK